MTKPVIAYDADGVLLDFLTPALHLVQEMTGIIATPLNIHTWDMMESLDIDSAMADAIYRRMTEPGYSSRIPLYTGAAEHIEWVKTWADVHIVTSPTIRSQHWAHERDMTFAREFGIGWRNVHHTDSKYLFDSDALVEDKTSNLEKWTTWGWTRYRKHRCALLFSQPYNEPKSPMEDRIVRVADYNQVERALQHWFEEAQPRVQ